MVKLRQATLCLLATVLICQWANLEVRADQAEITELNNKLETARKQGDQLEQACLLHEIGYDYFQDGNQKKAEEYFRQAIELADKTAGKVQKKKGMNEFIPVIHTRRALANMIADPRPADAAIVCQEALDLSEKMGQKVDAAWSAKLLANIYNKLGADGNDESYNDKAEATFKKAISLAKECDLPICQIYALMDLSHIERMRHNYTASLAYLNEASRLAVEDDDEGALPSRILREIGTTYADIGYSEQALTEYLKAAKDCQSENPKLWAQILVSIGELQVRLHRSEKAEKNLEKALEVLQAEKDILSLTKCMNILGSAKADLGKFDQARTLHKKAEELAHELGNKKDDELTAVTELGYDYYLEGNPEKALKEFLRAKSLLPSLKASPAKRAWTLAYCGFGYRALGQIPAAIQMYDEAARAYSEAKNPVQEASMLDSIAVAYLDQGQLDEFEKFHKKAMEIFARPVAEVADLIQTATTSGADGKNASDATTGGAAEKPKARVNDERTRVGATLAYNYAQYCQLTKKFPEAITSFEKALASFEAVDFAPGQCQVLKGMGLANLNLGQTQKAQAQFEKASALAEKTGNIESQWDCATGLGKVYKLLGDRKKAEEQYEKAVALAETERRQFSRDSFKTVALNLRENCFLDLIDLLVQDNKFDQALEVAEKGRARAFLDMLERRTQSSTRDRVALVTDDLLDTGKQAERPKLAMGTGPSTPGFRSVSVVPKTPSLVEASALSPVNAKAPTLTELKSLVSGSKSYFLEYVVLADKIIIWVVKPDGTVTGVKSVDISLANLKDLITNTYLSIVSAPKGVEDLHKLNNTRQEHLAKLYGILIKPVESLLPTSADDIITVVPYGPLFQVPFAALVNDKGRFMIEDHTLSYLPAIGVLRATGELKRDVAGLKKSLLAFGNPITQANEFLGKLPYSEKEVKKVASLFDKSLVNVAVGATATKSNFRKSAPGFTYIHLATHGLINQAQPMDSAVVLAPEGGDDGLLTVKDILELPPLKADLVVLSACQTGKGKIASDGVVGLSRAFVIAGTPSIMVSLWNVDDVMTEYQMENLYYELLKG
ncbi:MAG: CHAT domain-containing protein, partial [Cyanobacteria bacterium]|nr:CHAT domain-containing protein [Cyanobacteriota bacterium]